MTWIELSDWYIAYMNYTLHGISKGRDISGLLSKFKFSSVVTIYKWYPSALEVDPEK